MTRGNDIMTYQIDPYKCIACGTCADLCPSDAIAPTNKPKVYTILSDDYGHFIAKCKGAIEAGYVLAGVSTYEIDKEYWQALVALESIMPDK